MFYRGLSVHGGVGGYLWSHVLSRGGYLWYQVSSGGMGWVCPWEHVQGAISGPMSFQRVSLVPDPFWRGGYVHGVGMSRGWVCPGEGSMSGGVSARPRGWYVPSLSPIM